MSYQVDEPRFREGINGRDQSADPNKSLGGVGFYEEIGSSAHGRYDAGWHGVCRVGRVDI